MLARFFKGTQLQKARRAFGWSERDVAQGLGVRVEEVVAWEEEGNPPNPSQLETLAAIFGVREEYFLRITPETPTGAYFRGAERAQPAELSPATRKAMFSFYELCRYQKQLEDLLARAARPEVPHYEPTDPEDAAQWVREVLGLGSRPVTDVDALLFRQNIKIFRLEIPGEEFSGLSVWDPSFGPAVLVEARDPYYRQRFTLCHEYGHFVAGGDRPSEATVCDLDWEKAPERLINRFAAALLVSRHASELWTFAEQYPKPEPEELDTLCQHFRVSREVIARRLVELEMSRAELIKEVQLVGLAGAPPARWHGRRPSWKRRLGQRYLRLARDAYRRNLISLGKLAEYLGTDAETALAFGQGET
ncbi:MAG: ImmA/IrrE family metallo-endopeptidase [Dehalococcoidia bacterium]